LPTRELEERVKEYHKNKMRTTTITFRIDSGILQNLYDKADSDDISLNTLVNHILKRYVDWDMFIEGKGDMVPVSRPIVKEIFQRLRREEVIKVATEIGKSAVSDIFLFMKGGKIDLHSFMSWFLSRMKNCSEISDIRDERNGIHTYVLKHDLGENWSLYHKTILESIFNDMLETRIETSITRSTLCFKFEETNYDIIPN
jgi:hypothetical protein